MQPRKSAFKPSRAADWTKARIELLSTAEIAQLRINADRLSETEITALCDEVLRSRPKGRKQPAGKNARRGHERHLVSRSKAFETRGVGLQDARTSWGGVRKSDGAVVLTLWADAVQSSDGACSYLLWAPNVEGSRPWSDKPAGKERLEHCRLALARGEAEGLLVYGERVEGWIPEDKAHTVYGVDPQTVLRFQVEQRGKEFWATWGKKIS